jgi:hypothetical protein
MLHSGARRAVWQLIGSGALRKIRTPLLFFYPAHATANRLAEAGEMGGK